ncbi:M20 family metallo-hydrolase [Nioella sp.]|uniref:M20 family metallo-hydrolase n=1 Tax=Nioella sp. TaxID=1912091 RepID=UPI003B517D9D
MDWGKEAARRLAEIATCSAPGPGVTRFPFTAEHRAAQALITGWMGRAGLEVHLDAAGTLVGRREGPAGARTLLIGSHQDSVRGGGAYDGIMGIALACLALERLGDRDLPNAVEVLAFADEEGVRFPTALMGPRALAGTFDPGVLDRCDADGVSLREALAGFGGDPGAVAGLKRDPARALGYLELHIEQGPVLERAGQPVGVVSSICGIERNALTFRGETGHAGTVPMEARRDALVAASGLISTLPGVAADWPGLRATVGEMHLHPNVANAIPEEVRLVLEIRAERDADRGACAARCQELAEARARAAGCEVSFERSYEQPAVACDPELVSVLRRAAGEGVPILPSGATHDASAMADLCPMAMLFLRCRGGLSHRPEEFASPEDMGVAIEVLARAIAEM